MPLPAIARSERFKLWLSKTIAPLVAAMPGGPVRHFHAYAVGTPRSGTHSLAEMFLPPIRSAHEPQKKRTTTAILYHQHGLLGDAELSKLLYARDRMLRLDLEASHYLHHIIHILVKTFPAARFILSIREPASWLQSEIRKNLQSAGKPKWNNIEELRYGPYTDHFAGYELKLATLDNVRPLSCYLKYWRDHNQKVLSAVPSERILVIPTHEISSKVDLIADFLGVAAKYINRDATHRGQGKRSEFNLYDFVPEKVVLELVEEHCRSLWTQIATLRDY